ncbi:MAG: sulfite exporter TauE/SafE family protein, partial [Acidobacteriota bacterium]|nr:sulfite exporter TauE/SafE family protein [Acidobacteriota bacterium]
MHSFTQSRRRAATLLLAVLAISLSGGPFSKAVAHPLGQFTVNHFVRIETGDSRARIRYVVDLAEIPSFQEAQTADADRNGSLSQTELAAYLDRVAPGYVAGLKLTADGMPVEFKLADKRIEQAPGAAGLMTMRLNFDLTAAWSSAPTTNAAPRLRFENTNLAERAGWRELIVMPMTSVSVFNSTAYGNGVTDELKAYPEDLLLAPLNERAAEWSATRGALPDGAKPLTLRDGKPVIVTRDRFAELIAVQKLTPGVVLLGLLLAFILGGAHALSPGHGKTVVGAYLVGSRGTVKHAAFLGATVTITHTLGVFALGLVTLFASRYVLPEKLYPILSFISGALVVGIGATMFSKRLRALISPSDHDHSHSHSHHGHQHAENPQSGHTHLPPENVTWRSLLGLGISGGILPCPSALVLMLGAISLNRVGYGLVLITMFSLGLASVLTAVGLAFVYGGKLMSRVPNANKWMRIIPVVSAVVIAVLGAVICWQALQQAGVNWAGVNWGTLWRTDLGEAKSVSAMAILGLGLVIGLRHALDTDHLAAVSTIVSDRKNLFSSLLIGGLWGIGHTVSLLIAGVAVIFLNLKLEKYEKPLEFCVALMLIGLGANVLIKLARGGKIHLHEHKHGGHHHVHPHLHDAHPQPEPNTHHGFKLRFRPLVIG